MKAGLAGVACAAVMACGSINGAKAFVFNASGQLYDSQNHSLGGFSERFSSGDSSITFHSDIFNFDGNNTAGGFATRVGREEIDVEIFTFPLFDLDGGRVDVLNFFNFRVANSESVRSLSTLAGAFFQTGYLQKEIGPSAYRYSFFKFETAELTGSLNVSGAVLPLPKSSLMFGAALLVLSAIGCARRRGNSQLTAAPPRQTAP